MLAKKANRPWWSFPRATGLLIVEARGSPCLVCPSCWTLAFGRTSSPIEKLVDLHCGGLCPACLQWFVEQGLVEVVAHRQHCEAIETLRDPRQFLACMLVLSKHVELRLWSVCVAGQVDHIQIDGLANCNQAFRDLGNSSFVVVVVVETCGTSVVGLF